MDISEYLEFDSMEINKINNFEIELKEEKLRGLFFDLLENANWEVIFQLIDKKIPFYESVEIRKVLDKNILDCSNSISKCKKHIENIINISEEKYFLIKEIFTKCIVLNLIEMQSIPEIQRQDHYHIQTICIGKKLLFENDNLKDLFENVEIKEIKIIKKMLELEEKFPEKKQKLIKNKI